MLKATTLTELIEGNRNVQRSVTYLEGENDSRAVTYAELEFGVTASVNRARERRNLAALIEDIPVAPFDAAAASAYGPVREATRKRKKDALDKLIAAHAIALGVVLVTNNERDFAAYPGIKIDNWING